MITDIKTLVYLLAIVGGLQVINIVLGTINGTIETQFDFKKFLFGILKALINALCVIGTCALADVFAQVLNTIQGIEISVEIVSSIQIIAIIVIWCVDLFKDVFEKIKALKELKYTKYEDVIVKSPNEEQER